MATFGNNHTNTTNLTSTTDTTQQLPCGIGQTSDSIPTLAQRAQLQRLQFMRNAVTDSVAHAQSGRLQALRIQQSLMQSRHPDMLANNRTITNDTKPTAYVSTYTTTVTSKMPPAKRRKTRWQ